MLTSASWADLHASQAGALERFSELAGSVDPSLVVANLGWNVRQLVAHMVGTAVRYGAADPATMAPSAGAVADLNDADVQALADDVTMDDLLARLADGQARLIGSWRDLDLHAPLPFHAGLTISAAGAAGEWLGELLIHGLDLARAAGRRWPIASTDALLVASFVFEVLPGYVDSSKIGAPLAVEVRLRGGTPHVLRIDGGQVDVAPAGGTGPRVDAVVTSPATPWVLNGYGRLSLLRAIARGMLITGGRRPWRALELQRAVLRP